MLIRYQQQQRKVHDNRKHVKTLPSLHKGQEVLFLGTKGDWLSAKVTQISPELRHYTTTSPTCTTYLHTRRKLKALDYMPTPNIAPMPGPVHARQFSALHSTTPVPNEATPEKRAQFELSLEQDPAWHFLDNDEPSDEDITLPNNPLPTTPKELQPQPSMH